MWVICVVVRYVLPELRLGSEALDFDAERYYGDDMYGHEDPIFMEAMAFEPHWDRDPGDQHHGDQDHGDQLSFEDAAPPAPAASSSTR